MNKVIDGMMYDTNTAKLIGTGATITARAIPVVVSKSFIRRITESFS